MSLSPELRGDRMIDISVHGGGEAEVYILKITFR